ncbi:hypothetical protein D9756_007994 [Leucocoprinus leucothites]|uniref:DUF6535 domain-containing protein n=1 Tax=Leucocoprinus leucothites TaxID=201217 RepID=A0A8H5D4K3_9AGAR|nr:hypothetical protein D9756_007994 [Leucoagaricus leucothites]
MSGQASPVLSPQQHDKCSSPEVDPWEVCNKYAKKHTKELCESWRDEVDKLLIFAGLFSGVVTGFAIESYHSVTEDSSETTVLLLRTLVLQLDNITNPQSNPINLNPQLDKIPASAKRINTFWFLSLALSLSTVMAGILCLQWIREYERNANVSHREDVALHHMRFEGLRNWQVFKILSALPLLLIAALLLFFAGFIELLWEVDPTAAILVAIVVGVALLFIVLTTVLPAAQSLFVCAVPGQKFSQCPYKSPQAWMIHKCILLVSRAVQYWGRTSSASRKASTSLDLSRIDSWPAYDVFLRRRRDADKKADTRDVGRGLAWVGETFVQHQELVEAVSQCMRDLDPKIALESLAQMDISRADRVRDRVGSIQRTNSISESRRNGSIGAAKDLVVSHVLEHLVKKVEQAHMSSSLLRQRLSLFLKINEEGEPTEAVDCPVNLNNVAHIFESDNERDRVLQCINSMLEKDLECNATHTNGAFEILYSILQETPRRPHTLEVVQRSLRTVLLWVQKDSVDDPTSGKPERRLKQGVMFTRLILACQGDKDRPVINEFRRGIENHISSLFGAGLKPDPNSRLDYPYLAKFQTSRNLVDAASDGDLRVFSSVKYENLV